MASITKKRRTRKRADEDGDPEFQVAPMVDVLLVLMLFFMAITSTEVLKKEKNLHLAEANHAKPDDKNQSKKQDELVVNVSWDNGTAGFSMDGLRYPSADALQGVLARDHQQNPHAYVLIRADKDVEYSNISDLMNACAGAGIGTVSFAVITAGENQKTAAAGEGAASN
jgi:biopolymer transport protein ExbD